MRAQGGMGQIVKLFVVQGARRGSVRRKEDDLWGTWFRSLSSPCPISSSCGGNSTSLKDFRRHQQQAFCFSPDGVGKHLSFWRLNPFCYFFRLFLSTLSSRETNPPPPPFVPIIDLSEGGKASMALEVASAPEETFIQGDLPLKIKYL